MVPFVPETKSIYETGQLAIYYSVISIKLYKIVILAMSLSKNSSLYEQECIRIWKPKHRTIPGWSMNQANVWSRELRVLLYIHSFSIVVQSHIQYMHIGPVSHSIHLFIFINKKYWKCLVFEILQNWVSFFAAVLPCTPFAWNMVYL